MKTYSAKKSDVKPSWYVVDASGKVLGRLATRIATVLQGKHKPTYTPHIDTGDFIIVVNAAKVRVTGKKLEQKEYRRHTGYPGGLRFRKLSEVLERHPERVIELAVKRMLPKSALGRHMFMKLKVYAGADHPHAAQQPAPLEFQKVG